MFDLDAYLARIDLDREPDIASIHRAHVSAIPFENLDPHRGVPVSLDVEALERKLVVDRRGGYCFEQNLLLRAGLEAIGATVEPMLARVRRGGAIGPERPVNRPLTHLVLRVSSDREVWHADVGFGGGTLLEPIPFGPGGPYEQAGWRFRVVEDGDELVLQTEADAEWRDLYSFVPQPVAQVDIELSNWFVSTHPGSAFVNGLIVVAHTLDGTRTSLSDFGEDLSLVVRTATTTDTSAIDAAAIPEILAQRFGLPGFAVNGAGRVVLPSDVPN